MAPKKDDKKDAKAAVVQEGPTEEEKELIEKELLIAYLKSKVGRYQDQGERLQIENYKLSDDLETQKVNLKDITEFLTNELKSRTLTSSQLEERLVETTTQMEEQRAYYEAELARVKTDRDVQLAKAEERIDEWQRKMGSVEEFMRKKEALEVELSATKAALEAKGKELTDKLRDVERGHIQEKEKWRKEMTNKVKQAKLEMLKLTDDQLEATTKRTIIENEHMSTELAYQSRQTEKLMARNTQLAEQLAEAKRHLVVSQDTEAALVKKVNAYQKTVAALMAKFEDYVAMTSKGQLHQPSPLALESSRASIGAGSSASAGHSAAHAAGLHHGHAAHADSAAAAAAAGKKQTVREFVFTVVEQAKAQIAARMDSLTGGAGFAIGGDATELDTDGNAAGGSESGANEGSAEFGVSGNAIHKPPSKDLFLLHAAQGALDFLEQRLGMGGFQRVPATPPPVRGKKERASLHKPKYVPSRISLPPISSKAAREMFGISEPGDSLFLGHASRAEAAPLAGGHPPSQRLGPGTDILASGPAGATSPKMARELLGSLQSEVRPWGHKTATPPLR